MTKPATDEITQSTEPALIPQAHGGALLSGGAPGNRGNQGGTGRPPSVVRSIARNAWAERTPILEAIADGEAINRVKVPLAVVLHHAHCPNCDGSLRADDAAAAIMIEGTVSASAGERVRAMSELSKVGLGPTLSHDDIKERIGAMLQVLTSRETWTSKEAIDAIGAVWK